MPPKPKFTETDEKGLTWIFSYTKSLPGYEDAKKEDFMYKYNKKLLGVISQNTKWSDGSKQRAYFTVAKWLSINHPDLKIIDTYRERGFALKEQREAEEGENVLDAKEIENMKPRSYFLEILNKINPNEIKTRVEHMKYLLLSLLVKQPPVRTSYYSSAQIVKNQSAIKNDQNYIWLRRSGAKNKVDYVINVDKVSGARAFSDYGDAFIEVSDPELIQLIYDSHKKYPRKYLIEETKNKSVSDPTILKWLRDITGVKQLTVDMMRSSYITDFYEKNKTFGKRKELAGKMRHSVMTAARNYLKVEDTPMNIRFEKLEKENADLKIENTKLKNELEQYKETEDAKILRRKKLNIIYTANIKKVEPKESTIKKYDLKKDDKGKYY